MSYDIHLAEAPIGEVHQRRIATELSHRIPSFALNRGRRSADVPSVAELMAGGLSEEAASYRSDLERRMNLGLQIHDDNLGILVEIFPDGTATLDATYGAQGDRALVVVETIWRCLEVFDGGGYVADDPQLGRRLNLAVDRDVVPEAYSAGTKVHLRNRR